MKKSKGKASVDKPSASMEVDIASDALARLADKLKVDLAKSPQQPVQKSTPAADSKARRKSDVSAGKKSKLDESGKSQNNGTSVNGTSNTQAKKKGDKPTNSETSAAAKPAKSESPKQGKNKKQKVADTRSEKSRPVNEARTSQSAATKKDKNPENKGEKSKDKGEKSKGKGKIEKDPLFEEIIALGGTEEDLALLEGIDSDEDIEGESSPAQKPKQQRGNDKSVCVPVRLSLMI